MENKQNKLFNKENIMCALSIMIVVGSYAAQRIIEVSVVPLNKTLSLILAMVYTALLAVVLFLISKSKNIFFGILAALVGYKMMPPPLAFTSDALDGNILYFLVRRVAALIFVLIIYKLYKSQEEPHEIRSLPLLTILLCVPFFSKIAEAMSGYFYIITGSKLYGYFVQYACYAAAVLVILFIAYQSGYSSFRFTAYFEFTALAINALRKLGLIGYYATRGEHISNSLYIWIVLYAALAICFVYALNRKKKEIAKE